MPDASDVEQMVRIIDTFLPLCHGFLGKVFVQIPWLDIVAEQRQSEILVQAVLRLIVKLAAEPQVRQVSGSNMDVDIIKSARITFIMNCARTVRCFGLAHAMFCQLADMGCTKSKQCLVLPLAGRDHEGQ